MKDKLNTNNKYIKVIGVVMILLVLPLTLLLVNQVQDQRGRAAPLDKVEFEGGVLSGAVQKLSDTSASGGKFVRLASVVTSTPTIGPTSSPPTLSIPPGALYIPDSIDSTGTTDVTTKLKSFIENAPNGSTIVFKAGGTYMINEVIRIWTKTGITLEGNGATLKLVGVNKHLRMSAIFIEFGSRDTTVRNLNILGNHTTAGTDETCCAREGQHGIGIYGSFNTLIENVNITRIGGDCFYMGVEYGSHIWGDGVVIRDSTCTLTGRHAFDIKGVRNVLIENSTLDQIGLHGFNHEINKDENGPYGGAENIMIRNNYIGSYGLTKQWSACLLCAGGAEGSVVRNVTFTGNTIEGNVSGRNGKLLGLHVIVRGTNRIRENFTITNNTVKSAVNGNTYWNSPIYFIDSNNITVTGNTQPLTEGEFATFPDSTNVTYHSNNTN